MRSLQDAMDKRDDNNHMAFANPAGKNQYGGGGLAGTIRSIATSPAARARMNAKEQRRKEAKRKASTANIRVGG